MNFKLVNCRDWGKLPRFKLFFGADIVGSTALKQPFDPSEIERSIERSRAWETIATKFYSDVQDTLAVEWQDILSILEDRRSRALGHIDTLDLFCGPRPNFWKSLGDEVLFWKECTHPFQVRTTVICWMNTIAKVRTGLDTLRKLQKQEEDDWRRYATSQGTDSPLPNNSVRKAPIPSSLDIEGLDIKSCIWSAEFPVRNRILPASSGVRILYDSQQADHRIEPSFETIDKVSDQVISAAYYRMHTEYQRTAKKFEEASAGSSVGSEPTEDVNAAAESAHQFSSDDALKLDFIGPGIDTGFRVSSFASNRKMAISVDVAYLLASNDKWQSDAKDSDDEVTKYIDSCFNLILIKPGFNAYDKKNDNDKKVDRYLNPKIHYSGTDYLKGVLGGIKYPRLWIDTTRTNTYDAFKEALYIGESRTPLSSTNLRRFCEGFYKDRKKYILPPQTFSFKINDDSEGRSFNAEYVPAPFMTDAYVAEAEKSQWVYVEAWKALVPDVANP
ncbi:hypothetical protein [Blastomonas sp. SL216]|uniref:hypothetical protein n=1 Tax=Blastomonas sp. SL216 TaxID=2995169 RepID=UPI00237726E5|nr:hypothetical protein OU999_05730 [Blastomonas sp. SL216]